MGAIVGVVVGYVLGSRTTANGRSELRQSWQAIKTSEEVRSVLATGLTIAGGLANRGSQLLANRLQRVGENSSALRRVA
jgi:hypothetical protein